ncbi:MAG: hypothetical protein U0Y10_27045 [Spirosomataceae bacterium]
MSRFHSFLQQLKSRSSKIIALLILLACAGGPMDPNEFLSFFMPESSNASTQDLRYAFTPQFFYIDDEGYAEEDTTDASTDENVKAWMAYSKSNDANAIAGELYGTGTAFSRSLAQKGKTEAVSYLTLSKTIAEAYKPSEYSWEEGTKDSVALENAYTTVQNLLSSTKDGFLKERYAFQAVKLASILQKHDECVKLYEKWVAPLPKKSFISDWAYGRKAGADMRLGDSAKAYYEFAQLFDRCLSRRREADLSIRIYGLQKFEEQALSLCKTNQEKAAVYAVASIQPRTDALPMLEKIVEYTPQNPLIELIMTREINRTEFYTYTDTKDAVNIFYDADSTELASKKADASEYGDKLKAFALACTENKNLSNSAFWLTAAAYMEYMGKSYDKAEELLNKAIAQSPRNQGLKTQISMIQMLLTIDRQATLNKDLETAAIPYLEQFAAAKEFRTNNAFVQACKALAAKYRGVPLEKEAEKGGWWASCSKKKVSVPDVPFAKAKAYLMTILPSYQVRPENEYGFGANTDMYAVEDTTSSATIQEVIAYFSQPSPSDFDKRLMKLASVTQNDLYVLLGRRALAEHNYTQAAEAFGKVPDDFWEKEPFATYFNGNPFYLEPDEERNAEPVYTPATFAKRMAELQTKVKEDPSDAEAWYLLGCGAYNLSYFGSAWILVTRQWSSVELDYSSIENENNDYYNTNGARKYFDQAMKMAANNSEMAAKACFMASKCEQNAFFAYRGDETNRRYAKGNYDDNSAEMEKLRRQKYMTFFQLLKTRYRGTKFHKEILEECGDYADFVSSK